MQWIEKSSFLIYTKYLEQVKQLDMERRGVLFTALLEYAATGEVISMDDVTCMAFSFLRAQMDKDSAAYQEKVEARKKAGQLGGLAKKANANSVKANVAKGSNAKNAVANLHDNECEYECVNDKDKNTLADAKAMFERLWKMYPNKKGKGQVSDTQKKRLLAIGESTLVKAIERYSMELQKDAGWRKPQYGSTFFNSGYVDYLDGNYVTGKTPAERKKNSFCNFDQRQYDYDDLEKQLLNSNLVNTR